MKLIGIRKGKKYHSANGTHKRIPYRILEERGRFLLERLSIVVGVGLVSRPVAFFDSGWSGVYSEARCTNG